MGYWSTGLEMGRGGEAISHPSSSYWHGGHVLTSDDGYKVVACPLSVLCFVTHQFWAIGSLIVHPHFLQRSSEALCLVSHMASPRRSLASWLQLQYFGCISFIVGADVWFCHFSHSMTMPVHFFKENHLTFRVVTFLSRFDFFG